jgi:hypothetical protein
MRQLGVTNALNLQVSNSINHQILSECGQALDFLKKSRMICFCSQDLGPDSVKTIGFGFDEDRGEFGTQVLIKESNYEKTAMAWKIWVHRSNV